MLGLLSAPAQGVVEEPNPIEEAKAIYEDHLVKYRTEAEEKLAAWPTQYMAALQELREHVKTLGDLDGWTSTDAEIKRFEQDVEIADEDLVKKPLDLQKLQRKFKAAQSAIIRDKNRNVLTLTDKYAKRLTELEVELTKQARIEDALRARAEKVRAQRGRAVKRARFELAVLSAEDGSADRAVPEAPETAERDREEPEEREERDREEREKREEPKAERHAPVDDVAPYDPATFRVRQGNDPLEIEGLRFRKLTLKSTKHLRVGRKLAAVTELGLREEHDEHEVQNGRVRMIRHREDGFYMVRVSLRPVSREGVVRDSTIVVQMFSRSVNGSGGKNLKLILFDWTTIDQISFSQMTVETPSVVVQLFEDKLRRASAGRVERTTGEEYYGVVISVFDSGGELIYQESSQSRLEDQAVTTVPANEKFRVRATRNAVPARRAEQLKNDRGNRER